MDEQMDEGLGGQMNGRGREGGRKDGWMRCGNRRLMGDGVDR